MKPELDVAKSTEWQKKTNQSQACPHRPIKKKKILLLIIYWPN